MKNQITGGFAQNVTENLWMANIIKNIVIQQKRNININRKRKRKQQRHKGEMWKERDNYIDRALKRIYYTYTAT